LRLDCDHVREEKRKPPEARPWVRWLASLQAVRLMVRKEMHMPLCGTISFKGAIMKIQIKRFAPHQNAKVIAVLMAVSSLMLFVPVYLLFTIVPPVEGQPRPPAFMFLILPLVYLVMGYLMVAIGCALYNVVCKSTGGIEYEADSKEA
jgi:hypothetical protein